MTADRSWWPLFDLRVSATAAGHDLLLRTPTDADLPALLAIAPAELEMDPTLPGGSLAEWVPRHVWRARAESGPDRWRLVFLLECDGELAGTQDLKAVDFPRLRIVETSSWLGLAYRGRGLAKAMRAMVLHLAFTQLDAVAAESESEEHNDAALGVTRSLGYQPCGDTYAARTDRVDHMLHARLTRQRWALLRGGYGVDDLRISGAEQALALLVG
ncbi:GNAT family N-acetyltransferase [Fodinicola acaciae]|uniref:GNAT family N-acetyltransferase n=1 Tax=Fodinicola acaciae TaxID=2681555 RepID=UPI0013D66167|nr:GNAT family protein [Fodinicola acaciae]